MTWDYVPEVLRIRYDEQFVSIPNAVRRSARRFPDNERPGEVAVAFVVPRRGVVLTAEDFLAWASEHVANFKARGGSSSSTKCPATRA